MWHNIFIGLHAAAGVLAFLAGWLALRSGGWTRTHVGFIAATGAFLLLAIAVDWSTLGTPTRLLFAAFVTLAGFMLWRAFRAHRSRPHAPAGPSRPYVHHLGFNLISLFDAFAVITVLNLGAPGWAVAASGVLVAIAGHLVLGAAERRLVAGDRLGPREPSPVSDLTD